VVDLQEESGKTEDTGSGGETSLASTSGGRAGGVGRGGGDTASGGRDNSGVDAGAEKNVSHSVRCIWNQETYQVWQTVAVAVVTGWVMVQGQSVMVRVVGCGILLDSVGCGGDQ
jgi:hypothetical protein